MTSQVAMTEAESPAAAKRRMRRIPHEFRKRNAQSCDRCRKVSTVHEDSSKPQAASSQRPPFIDYYGTILLIHPALGKMRAWLTEPSITKTTATMQMCSVAIRRELRDLP